MRQILLLTFLMIANTSFAQTHVSLGGALGEQPYENAKAKVLTSLEGIVERKAVGLHVATEYSDLDPGGALLVTHADAVYRFDLEGFSVRAGAGPTYVSLEELGSEVTWNLELEIAHRVRSADIFLRVRQYDYTVGDFREQASPSGAAFYAGVRFSIH
jgi:hypothetical protein